MIRNIKANFKILSFYIFSFSGLNLFCSLGLYAQKHLIDSTDMLNWTKVGHGKLSADGRYAVYMIENAPRNRQILVLRSIKEGREFRFADAGSKDAKFSKDGKWLYFSSGEDKLVIVNLITRQRWFEEGIKEWKLLNYGGHESLLYVNNKRELRIKRITDGKSVCYSNVNEYQVMGIENTLVLLTDTKAITKLTIYRAFSTIGNQIWEGKTIRNLTCNRNDMQLAFIDIDEHLWYYNIEISKAIKIFFPVLPFLKDWYRPDVIDRITKDGQILLKVKFEKENSTRHTDSMLVIWSYQGPTFQLMRPDNEKSLQTRLVCIDSKTAQYKQLIRENSSVLLYSNDDEWLAYNTKSANQNEKQWNKTVQDKTFLVNRLTGINIQINPSFFRMQFSSNGKYLFGYSGGDIFSVSLLTGKVVNITQMLPIPRGENIYDMPVTASYRGLELIGWRNKSNRLLIHDRYDLWEVDPAGRQPSVCITNGFGRRNQMTLRPVDDAQALRNNRFILSAFNNKSKQAGFYQLTVSGSNLLKKIYMGDCNFQRESFVKASDVNVYLLIKESSVDPPNFFLTDDFRQFSQLSNESPHKNLKWGNRKLLQWTTANGELRQGVLYLPEDLDEQKKYPVLVNYYEKKSDRLNEFGEPQLLGNELGENLAPWFNSRGYLMFTLDMHYETGYAGPAVLNCLNIGINELLKLPFVDSLKMGIQGHSWGGYETNYIVANSHRFAAAISAAGLSDYLSLYFQFNGGHPAQGMVEVSQPRMGGTLWEKMGLYLKNSPIYQADNVRTPLLLMANKEDPVVPFFQGAAFFSALRRLGKSAWLLEYNHEGHSVGNISGAYDYLHRCTQFLDHYLKGAPVPLWMTHPGSTSMEYDTAIKTPGPGLLTPEEQKKVDSLSKIPLEEKLKMPLKSNR